MNDSFVIERKERPTFYFIGVTTGHSSIMKIFPLWMQILGCPEIVLEGVDHKIHDDPSSYRQSVAQIKYDPLSLGGLVTTHKIDLLMASKDMFDFLDPFAQITGEVSSISKFDNKLEGHAKDPISSGLSLDTILGENYFERTGGEVLCFGAGGSAIATLLHLINKKNKSDRPKRFVFINRSQQRLDHAKEMVARLNTDINIEYICNDDPSVNDSLLAMMPDSSVIINATGMGKDIPGSPITNNAVFPRNSIAWEFNYRGELDFLHQAEAQKTSRSVVVEDGWLYFLHGWTQVIAQVLQININKDLFTELTIAAESVHKK